MADKLDKLFESGQDLDATFEKGQDISAPEAKEAPSTTAQDFAKGAHQGMMLGAADELGGLGSAIGQTAGDSDLMSKLSNWYYSQKMGASPEAQKIAGEAQPLPQTSFYDKYRTAQQSEQADFDAAKAASPWAYGAGQMVGGLVPGIASGGLAKAAPLATATVGGAITGAGDSHGTIEDPLALATDTAIGGGLGLGLGALGNKIFGPKVPKPEKDILQRGEFVPQLEAAARMGEEGISLSSKPEARRVLTERLKSNAEEMAAPFIAPRKQLGQALESTIKAGDTEAGYGAPMASEFFDTVGDISQSIQDNVSSIGRKRAGEILQKLDDLKQGLLKPEEINILKKDLQDVAANSEIPQLRSTLKTGINEVKNHIESLAPGYKEASQDFAQFARKGPEALLSKGYDPDVADVFLGDMSRGDLKITEKVKDLLGSIRSGGTQGLKKQEEFFNAMQQLEQLAQENPELVKKIGIDPAKLTREFIKKADEAEVAQKAAGESLAQTAYERGKFGIRKATETGLLKGANIYGQTKRTVRDFVSGGKEDFANAAQILKEKGGPDLQSWGEELSKAVASGDMLKRNAAVFSLMQMPKAKELLGIGKEEDK